MCMYVEVELSVCYSVGVSCCGFVFVPGGLGLCTCVSMWPLGTGVPAYVHMWSGAGFRLRPVASTCTRPGPSAGSHGYPMQL